MYTVPADPIKNKPAAKSCRARLYAADSVNGSFFGLFITQ